MVLKKECKIMNKSWIFYVCKRFSRVDRSGRSAATSILATLGICLGVTTLIVIMSVMNGFQMSFIDTILEVSSYHLQVSDLPSQTEQQFYNFCKEDSYIKSKVKSISPFYEAQTLIVGEDGSEGAAIIRAVEKNVYEKDSAFSKELSIIRGSFDISKDNFIVIGSSLARQLGVKIGDTVNLFVLSGGNDVSLFSNERMFVVTGVFSSGYAEVNSSYCFVNIDVAKKYFGQKSLKKLGIKLFNSEDAVQVYSKIKNFLGTDLKLSDLGFNTNPKNGRVKALSKACLDRTYFSITTWQDYNKSFYSTLKIEKNMLLLLIALIFVVVAINIFNSMRRLVYERRNEIAIFSSLGATSKQIQLIFVFRGLLTGLIGSFVGVILGLIISYNSDVVFNLAAKVIYAFEYLFTLITNPAYAAYVTENSTYSLYATIPARVYYDEVCLISLFGILSPLLACFFASKSILKMKIVEVLHE